jgi:hypothetical protein
MSSCESGRTGATGEGVGRGCCVVDCAKIEALSVPRAVVFVVGLGVCVCACVAMQAKHAMAIMAPRDESLFMCGSPQKKFDEYERQLSVERSG